MLGFARARRHEPPASRRRRHRRGRDVLRCDAPRTSSRRSGRSTSASRSACSRTTTTSRRVRDAGYRVVCAEDVFVHHFGEASLGELAARRALRRALPRQPPPLRGEVGRHLGAPRPPPRPRRTPRSPAASTRRVREHVPAGATVLVASRGDEALVDARGPRGLALPAARRRRLRRPPPGRRRGGDRRARAAARAGRRVPRAAGDLACGGSTTTSGFRRHLEDRYRVLHRRRPRRPGSTGSSLSPRGGSRGLRRDAPRAGRADPRARDRPRQRLAAGEPLHPLAARARLVGHLSSPPTRTATRTTPIACASSASRPTSATTRPRTAVSRADSTSPCSRSGSPRPGSCR